MQIVLPCTGALHCATQHRIAIPAASSVATYRIFMQCLSHRLISRRNVRLDKPTTLSYSKATKRNPTDSPPAPFGVFPSGLVVLCSLRVWQALSTSWHSPRGQNGNRTARSAMSWGSHTQQPWHFFQWPQNIQEIVLLLWNPRVHYCQWVLSYFFMVHLIWNLKSTAQ